MLILKLVLGFSKMWGRASKASVVLFILGWICTLVQAAGNNVVKC